MKHALIDGDIVVYSAGFANNERSYICPDGLAWRYKKEAVEHCREKGLDTSSIERRDAPGPMDFAFSNIKKIINKIMTDTECEDYTIFLSGEENARKKVDPTYKANRDDSHKPTWYEEMREYLVEHHGAIITEYGDEADDYLGRWQQPEDTIICTLDKDLDQIVGWHYNWKSGETYYVTSDEGNLFFWMQMLMGDTADNVTGIRGIGPVKAHTMLHTLDINKRRCMVGLQYAIHFDDAEKKFLNNAELLFIQR